MSEWKPIEEAPRDGTSILVWRKGGQRIVARWRPGWRDWYSVPGDYPTRPTHFMPLPDPPK